MSEQTDNIAKILTPFGISEEEAKIYLILAQKGVLSALQISREIGMARTKVYRILDKLLENKLVTVQMGDNGQKFEANSYSQLELLLKEREAETEKLRLNLPTIINQLGSIWGQGSQHSKVLYYTGLSGLEQVTWNSLRAQKYLRIYEVGQDMTAFLDPKFSEKVREELVNRQITTLQLTNKKHILPYTKVPRLAKEFWEVRYLDPKKLALNFEMLVYNDVLALYNFQKEDQFCIEIHNQNLATTQIQLFDFIWQTAKKMKTLDSNGEARVL